MLLDDSTRIADAARRQGISVTLQIWPHLWHVWHLYAGLLPEANAAIGQMAELWRRGVMKQVKSGSPAGLRQRARAGARLRCHQVVNRVLKTAWRDGTAMDHHVAVAFSLQPHGRPAAGPVFAW